MSKILVVDDEEDIRKILHIYLSNNGFEVCEAENGAEALNLLQEAEFDLAVIDVMMPVMDGITLCMKIRDLKSGKDTGVDFSSIPIIMLSAKDGDMDKVMGLTTGADDYVAKPFNPVELLARVNAQLRRRNELNRSKNDEKALTYEGLRLDIEKRLVYHGGEQIRLTPTEYEILKLLWENRGVVFSTDRIYNRIWTEEDFEVDNTVMVHIRNIRDKIETDKKKPIYIKTVWGVGYKFGE